MSTVIELLAEAEKVAVELFPLDGRHAEAAAELAELETRIGAAREKAAKALQDKAGLSARFEEVVGRLRDSGVERAVVQKAVDQRIEFLVGIGVLSQATAPSVGHVSKPAGGEAAEGKPIRATVTKTELFINPPAHEPEPAKAVEPEAPQAPADAVVEPTVEIPGPETSAPAETLSPAPEDAGTEPAPAAPEVVDLPPFRGAGASPIPAARQRRPRIVPVIDEPAAAADEEPIQEVPTVEAAAETAPEAKSDEGLDDTGISEAAYDSVLLGIDRDAAEPAPMADADEGIVDSILPESAPVEETKAPEPAKVEPIAAVEPETPVEPVKPAEPPKAPEKAESAPADEGAAFIPEFLR